jgi:hypothetical protein
MTKWTKPPPANSTEPSPQFPFYCKLLLWVRLNALNDMGFSWAIVTISSDLELISKKEKTEELNQAKKSRR